MISPQKVTKRSCLSKLLMTSVYKNGNNIQKEDFSGVKEIDVLLSGEEEQKRIIFSGESI